MSTVLQAIRAAEWWEHKLAPLLGTGYATAFLLGASLLDSAPALLLALAALVSGATFVSLLNDLTDIEADRAAAKPNRAAGRPRATSLAAVAACVIAGGALAAAAWRDDAAVLLLYAGAWI